MLEKLMMRKKMKCGGSKLWIVAGVSSVLLASSPGFAEELLDEKSPEEIRAEMSASGLLSEAGRLLKLENYTAAAPFLSDYLVRMTDSDDDRVLALMQDVRFKLGKINVLLGDSEGAQAYFEEYMVNKPIYKRREVLKSLAVSYFEVKDFENSISAVTNAFAPPPVEVVDDSEKKVKIEDLSKDELGGLTKRQMRRFEKEAEEFKDEFFDDLSADKPEEEPEYTLQEEVLLNMTLAESYAGLNEWSLSVEPYEFVIEHAEKMDRRGFAIMKLVGSLSALEEYDRVRTLIMDLSQTEARYDIRVNMAMLNAASSLFNVTQYDSALTLYRMILPRQALADHHMMKANALRREAGLSEMTITVATNESGRVETLLGYKYAETTQNDPSAATSQYGGVEMPQGLVELEESIGSLLTLSPYEDDVIYRTGQLYLECGRPWEALCSFDLTAQNDPEGERGIRAFCDALQVMVNRLALYDRVEQRSLSFLKKYTEGLPPRQVAYQLTAAYQKQEKFKEIKTLRPYMDAFAPSNDLMAQQYECELYYMQAIADLMLLDYKTAQDGFKLVLAKFPGSHQEDNVRYWHAMTQLFLQDYSTAYDEFEYYLDKFPKGNWVASSWFQSGICLFGQEQYDPAQERFTYVIDTHPVSTVYPDACSMRGDILGSKGLLDEAIRDYREAIATAKKPGQAAYAVFQLAAVFEAESRYNEIITLVNSYLDRYGEEADVAKAAYWIGKIKMEQGLVGEAVDAYLKTILEYGGDIRQDGVDLIIAELMMTTRRLDDAERAQLRERLTIASSEADNVTLQLRLRVMLADMDGAKVELGQTLISELQDLKKAPPPVLAVICDASFAKQDYSRSEEILTIFLNYFEDSEYMRAAYKLRGFDLFAQERLDEAMNVVTEAQGLYGVDDDTAWAQIMKGRLEIIQGNLDAARKSFRMVLGVRAWRGEPYAQACYYLGKLEEQAGDPKKAFAWYQRTYSLYKGLAGGYWAAESYLASAGCLVAMGRDGDMRNTYRAMLYDKYVNTLPQAEQARQVLGAAEVLEITQKIEAGVQTNLTVEVEAEETQ